MISILERVILWTSWKNQSFSCKYYVFLVRSSSRKTQKLEQVNGVLMEKFHDSQQTNELAYQICTFSCNLIFFSPRTECSCSRKKFNLVFLTWYKTVRDSCTGINCTRIFQDESAVDSCCDSLRDFCRKIWKRRWNKTEARWIL